MRSDVLLPQDSMAWGRREAHGAAVRRDFVIHCNGRRVPGCLWHPEPCADPLPLVLIGHGGSGHKRCSGVLDIVDALLAVGGFAACAIDGPVHGERRATFAEGTVVRDEFRVLWAQGGSIDGMVEDWRVVLDAMCELDVVDADAVGWYGLSMGTAFGLPLIAADTRIRAAVVGMWGTSRPGSERLASDAPRIAARTLFQVKWDDPLFTREGQFEIFDLIGSPAKQLNCYPGGHVDPAGPQLEDAVAFLRGAL